MACSADALGESRPRGKKIARRGAGTEFVGLLSKLAALVPLAEAGGAP
jgi:hypothetical protein